MAIDRGRDSQRGGRGSTGSRSAFGGARRPARSPDPRDRNWQRGDALVSNLELVLARLRTVFGTAVTAELALRGQGAERDGEIADCLRGGVSGPLADQIEQLAAFVAHPGHIGREDSGSRGRAKPKISAHGVRRTGYRRRPH